MRVSKAQAAAHRERILNSAARLFREQGIGATGVDAIAEDAGLTHGAVYSQFGSKEAITIESIRLALGDSKRIWLRALAKKGRRKSFPAIVEAYLSTRHRDAPGRGCLVATLGGELSRLPRSVRDAFSAEFTKALQFLVELAGSDDGAISNDDALAAFATMAGAMMLARAVTDEGLSKHILEAAANWIEGRAQSTALPRPRRVSGKTVIAR